MNRDHESLLTTFGTPEGLDLEAISDAIDSLGVGAVATGLGPLWDGAPPFAGPAVTMELVCEGFPIETSYHLGVDPILAAEPGSVIVVDHRGREHSAGWGGLLTRAAKVNGVVGVVVDGAARDVLEAQDVGLSVYGTRAIAKTARARAVQRSSNQPIDFRGVPVRPGDLVFVAPGGVAVLPAEHADAVLALATKLARVESTMAEGIDAGNDLREVFGSRYELMLQQEPGESAS